MPEVAPRRAGLSGLLRRNSGESVFADGHRNGARGRSAGRHEGARYYGQVQMTAGGARSGLGGLRSFMKNVENAEGFFDLPHIAGHTPRWPAPLHRSMCKLGTGAAWSLLRNARRFGRDRRLAPCDCTLKASQVLLHGRTRDQLMHHYAFRAAQLRRRTAIELWPPGVAHVRLEKTGCADETPVWPDAQPTPDLLQQIPSPAPPDIRTAAFGTHFAVSPQKLLSGNKTKS